MIVDATKANCPYDSEDNIVNVTSTTKTAESNCEKNIFGRLVEEDSGSGGGKSSGSSKSSSSGCFVAGTQVILADGSLSAIEELELGDALLGGGIVGGTLEVLGNNVPLVDWHGIVVSGDHGIKDAPAEAYRYPDGGKARGEGGRWMRAHEAGRPLNASRQERVLWNVIAWPSHRLFLRAPDGSTLEAADYMEVDDTSDVLAASLAALNLQEGGASGPGEQAPQAPQYLPLEEGPRRLGCFPPDALVELAGDGVAKRIDAMALGDEVAGGGRVTAVMRLTGAHETLFHVGGSGGEEEGGGGVIVSGLHPVRDPFDGVWRHAQDAKSARRLDRKESVLFNLITSKHRIHVSSPSSAVQSKYLGDEAGGSSTSRTLLAADFLEHDEDEEFLAWNIAKLNAAAEL